MAEIGGNQPGLGVTPITVNTVVAVSHNNRILDVTAGSGAIDITLPAATGVPNGVRVIVRRNASSTHGVVIGSPISKTLDANANTCEIISDGTTWVELTRGGGAPAAHASSHADGGTDEVTPLAIGAPVLHGFVNRTDSTLGMSGAKLQVTTASSYDFYVNGTKYTKTTTQEVTISNDNTLHYVYYTAAGLQVATSPWDIEDLTAIPVATVYKTGSAYALSEERHGYLRSLSLHKWAHTTVYARWVSGFAATFNNTSFSIAIGVIADEDIQASSGGTKTACRLWYRNSGAASMTFESNISYPWKNDSGPKYDPGTGLAAVGTAKFFNSWVYASTDVTYPIYIVVGQTQHNTLALARNEAQPTIPLTTTEWKLLYRATYQESSGSATYIETADYRQVSTGPATGGFTPTSHLGLTDIGSNTHAQIDAHIASTSNPHSVTAAQLGGAVVPAAGLVNVVGIANGETAYTNKALYDTTNPAALGTAAPGSAVIAARRDHVHAMPTASDVGAYYDGGTDVKVADGGTGVSTLASNGVLYGNGTNAVQALAVNSTATNKYLRQVSSGAPSWEIPAGSPSGDDVAVADGGTGASTAAGARTNLGVDVPSFSATHSNTGLGTLLSAGSWNLIPYMNEIWDTHSWYTPTSSNYRYTPGRAGKYRFSASIALESASSGYEYQIAIVRNGDTWLHQVFTVANDAMCYLQITCLAEANGSSDYFDVRVLPETYDKYLSLNASYNKFQGEFVGY